MRSVVLIVQVKTSLGAEIGLNEEPLEKDSEFK
jgi:hypothetical protein